MARPPRVLTETDYRTLERLVHAQQRQITSLSNRLAAYGMRRHQGVYMPSAAASLFSASAGTTTISVGGSVVTQINLTSASTSSAFSLDSGIITASTSGLYRVELQVGTIFSQFVRNDELILQFRVEKRDDPLDSWGGGFTCQRTTYHPDVAVASGAGGTNTYNEFGVHTFDITTGSQWRVSYSANEGTTLGTVSASSVRIRFAKG